MGDHNVTNFCTYYGDIYGGLLFHKSYLSKYNKFVHVTGMVWIFSIDICVEIKFLIIINLSNQISLDDVAFTILGIVSISLLS